jgi:hypothetical protein
MPESPELAEFKTSVSIVIILVNVYVILISPNVSPCRQRTQIEGLSIAVGLGKPAFNSLGQEFTKTTSFCSQKSR